VEITTSITLPYLLARRVAAAHNQHRVVQAPQIAADPVADDIEEAGIVVDLRSAANGIVED
jgi:hypothetical protein